MVNTNGSESSRISGGDFFVIFGREGKDFKKNFKFEISNGHNWGASWSYRGVSTTKKCTSELFVGGASQGGGGARIMGKLNE